MSRAVNLFLQVIMNEILEQKAEVAWDDIAGQEVR